MKIQIKNMVCNRCIDVVRHIFETENIPVKEISLGEVDTPKNLSEKGKNLLNERLVSSGFEILEDTSGKQIEKIKNSIIEKVAGLDIEENFRLSEFISGKLHKEYSSLSKLFSQFENVTLEQYFILQKIEKAKELLAYRENTLTEIATMLGYKSIQHLSSQFRKITGFSPTQFQKLKHKNRKPLDGI